MSWPVLIRRPSAFLPVGMSLVAIALVLVHVAVFGAAREADEGGLAHLWQLLMIGQVPIVAFLTMKWLPRAPGRAMVVLTLQAAAAVGALAPVYPLGL